MRAGRRHLAAFLVGAALLVSAGCGSDDKEGKPLPRDAVASIDRRLDEVERRFRDGTENDNAGACEDIENDSYKAIDQTVEDLPDDVDEDVRNALEESLAKLQDLTSEGCSDVKPTKTEPDTTPEETTPPETITETVPVPTETETQPERTTTQPNDRGNGNGNGRGNGNGQGGTTPPGQTGGTTPGGGN